MERLLLQRVLSSMQGDFLVQIGGLPELSESSPIRHKCFLNTKAKWGSVQTALDELPLFPQSVDVILMIHVLEFCPKPPVLLREAIQALAPGGQLIIVSLNPWSLWGLKHGLTHDESLPWKGHFWSLQQVKRWLHKLGLRIVTKDTFCFRPPLKRAVWWRRLLWLETLGSFCFPLLGGFFLLTAQKRMRAMMLIPQASWTKKMKTAAVIKLTTRTASK